MKTIYFRSLRLTDKKKVYNYVSIQKRGNILKYYSQIDNQHNFPWYKDDIAAPPLVL